MKIITKRQKPVPRFTWSLIYSQLVALFGGRFDENLSYTVPEAVPKTKRFSMNLH